MCSTFSFDTSDRIISNLDTLVPFDSTKAYDILDVIYPVSTSVISTVDRLLRCHLTALSPNSDKHLISPYSMFT